LIQPFQQPERVVGFFNTYRQLHKLRFSNAPISALMQLAVISVRCLLQAPVVPF
jgi:hypothetical protein